MVSVPVQMIPSVLAKPTNGVSPWRVSLKLMPLAVLPVVVLSLVTVMV